MRVYCIGNGYYYCFVMYFGVVFQVFDLMRKQEQSRLAELDAEKVNYELIQTQGDIVSHHLLKIISSCFLSW